MILEAKNINKTYENGENTLCVLDELNLTVDKSEIITIMGESGSGKSTLLNILGTLDHPDKGEVYIQGKNVTTLPEIELAELRNCHIGFVFQFHHLLPEFTAYENILMPAMISGNEAEKRKEVDDLLAFVDLGDRKSVV